MGSATGDTLSDCVDDYAIKCYNTAETATIVYEGGVSGTKVFETEFLVGDSSSITCELEAPLLSDGTTMGTQTVVIDLSCTNEVVDDLYVDDEFGALRIWGYTNREDGYRQQCRRPKVPEIESITCEACCSEPPTFCSETGVTGAQDKFVPKAGKCVDGTLPASTRAQLKDFVINHGGATCQSNNREPSGAKGSVVWTSGHNSNQNFDIDTDDVEAQVAAVEAQVAAAERKLCNAEANEGNICPDLTITFTCCDPCRMPGTVLSKPDSCIETEAKFSIGFQTVEQCPMPEPRPCLEYPDVPAFSSSPFISGQLIPLNICPTSSSTISSMQFQYISGSAAASKNTQGDVGVVMGTSKGTASTITVVSAVGGNIGQTFAEVREGDYFTVKGIFGDDILLDVQSIGATGNTPRMQRVNIHTSCSAPLAVGDQFGGIVVTGFNGYAVATASAAISTGTSGYSLPVVPFSVNVAEDVCYMETCPFGYDYSESVPTAPPCTLCCSMSPYFTEPFDEDFPKVDNLMCSNDTHPLPAETMTALSTWFDSKGGATCTLRNMGFDEPVWHAYVHHIDGNKTEVMNASEVAAYFCEESAGTCPSASMSFKCCDPCADGEPDEFCEEGTVDLQIFDNQKPVIKVDSTAPLECKKNVDPNDAIRAWEDSAVCSDAQQPSSNPLTINSTTNISGYPLVFPVNTTNRCNQRKTVTLDCMDDCENDVSASAEFFYSDTQKPFFVERPKDFSHTCDGTLGLNFLSDRTPFDANMSITDTLDLWVNRGLTGYEGSADDKCAAPEDLVWTPNTLTPIFVKEVGSRSVVYLCVCFGGGECGC